MAGVVLLSGALDDTRGGAPHRSDGSLIRLSFSQLSQRATLECFRGC